MVTLVDGLGIAGGGETFAREVALRLDGRRFERVICISRWSEEDAHDPAGAAVLEELRSAGVEVLGLRRRSRLALWAWRPLLSLLRRRSIDVLHAHKFGSNVWAAVFGTIARTPVIVAHEQTWSFEGNPIRRFLDRELIARRADAFICVSSEDRRRMIEIERIDPEKIVFVPNATPVGSSTGLDLRAELGFGADDPVIGTVCVLRPQKALDVLLRAAALVRGEFPQLQVVIAGDGDERERLERLVAELSLDHAVWFLGHRDDVPDVLAALDLAVSSSDYEGTPLAVMEFMAAGLPVVATRVGGVPDLIEDGTHGLLVPRRDPQRLAEAIADLLRDPDRARTIAAEGQRRQREEFDIDVTVRKIEALYERLYAATSRARSRR